MTKIILQFSIDKIDNIYYNIYRVKKGEYIMDKNLKFTLTVLVLAIVFVVGSQVGTYYTLKHQVITKTSSGYMVELDGELYDYTED